MRMAIGLAAILVTLGIIIWIMSAVTLPSAKQAIDTKERVQPQIEQIAGHTADGTRAVDTVQVKADNSGGKMRALIVTDIVEGAAMHKHFGLQKGDAITEIGPLSVRDMGSTDEAKDYLTAEYQRSGQITVIRDDKELKLPLPRTAAEPAQPAGTGGNSLQQQLDAIQSAPR